jgi:hypothetical protein
MNDTLKVIVQVLESGKPELQVAAAQILGELRPKDPTAVRTLGAALDRSPVLGRFCLEALAKIGSREAVELIAEALLDNETLADHAAHLLGDVGAAAQGVLARAYERAVGEQRLRILGILARSIGKEATSVFVHALLTPETTQQAGEMLMAAEAAFGEQEKKGLRDGLAAHLDDALPEACLAQVATVLAKLDPAGSRALLVKLTAPTGAPLVRSAAFRALRGSKLTAPQVRAMMATLEDPDEKAVHDAVRDLLVELAELPADVLPVVKRLLAARQPEQRLFAMRMLRRSRGAELAKVALKFLVHDDERFRDAAAEALAHNKSAIEPLIRLVYTTRDLELAQRAADILVQLGPEIGPKARGEIVDKSVRLLATHPRSGELLLGVALATGGGKMGPMLIDRAVRMRRARRYGDALHVLARLAASPHGSDEGRYQLAVTKLLQDMSQPAAEPTSPGDPTMGFFAQLVRNGFPLAERLRKENAVTPEAMLRLASHFAEAVGAERRFGTELLKHLAQRSRGRAGDEARLVLRAVGG